MGAVAVFAVGQSKIAGISIPTIGYILLVAAAMWLVLGMVAARPKKISTTESVAASADGSHVEREVATDGA